MKVEVKVPAMGESINEATIGTILKPSGTQVKADDELLELETDKVNQVLYAPAAGVITWDVKPEQVVKIGEVLGSIDSSKVEQTEKPVEPAKAPTAPTPIVETKKPVPQTEAVKTPTTIDKPKPQEKISGSSAEARILKDSFIAELKSSETLKPPQPKEASVTPPIPQALQAASASGPVPARTEQRKKMSKVRRVIARRLVEVMHQTAMLTTFNEVDMSAIMSLRDLYKDAFIKQHNTKLGFMSFFVKASVAALQAFPDVNAYIDGEEMVYRQYFDIGVAVGTDKGVFVPVIRNCNTLSFSGIERSIELYAKKAREGGLIADDLQGGGFTITNGGVYGSLLSTPILNPPQSAILGMHKIEKRPIVINDQIVIRPMMYLALSYDHRIIDGKEAVSFLVHIKNNLEDPSRLLLEV